jgi:prepilin-type N-terminal cleavage/methylation domain-containing protein
MSRQRGFSLIELIIVIVVVSIAVVAIGGAFAFVSRSLALNEDQQRASQLAQECAEHVLSRTRPPRGHFATVAAAAPSADCNGLNAGAYTRVVNVNNMAAGGALCAAGWACKWVQVTVTRGNVAAEVNFMIVQY